MSIAEKLTTVAENVEKVYEAGKKAEYDAFWDRFQKYGNRRAYNFAFINAGKCWDKTNFRPKYNIILEGNANSAFYSWQGLTESVDIGAVLKAQGVTLNTSNATNLNNLFQYGSSIGGSLPTIDLTKAESNTANLFDGTKITTIEKLVVTTTTNFTNMFRNCTNLANIVIEGTITTSGLDLSACTNLSADSLESVVNALSSTVSGSMTFPDTAQATYEAKYGANSWYDLIDTKRNWSIAY